MTENDIEARFSDMLIQDARANEYQLHKIAAWYVDYDNAGRPVPDDWREKAINEFIAEYYGFDFEQMLTLLDSQAQDQIEATKNG